MRISGTTLLQYSFGTTLVVNIARSLLPDAFALALWIGWLVVTASMVTLAIVRRKVE
jgi:hypothetical protein